MNRFNRLLAVVIVLQGLTLLGQWTGGLRMPAASAQNLDPARDRLQMIEEQKATNSKLDRLITLLESGKVQVRVEAADEKK